MADPGLSRSLPLAPPPELALPSHLGNPGSATAYSHEISRDDNEKEQWTQKLSRHAKELEIISVSFGTIFEIFIHHQVRARQPIPPPTAPPPHGTLPPPRSTLICGSQGTRCPDTDENLLDFVVWGITGKKVV